MSALSETGLIGGGARITAEMVHKTHLCLDPLPCRLPGEA
jgi:hypothetical protein